MPDQWGEAYDWDPIVSAVLSLGALLVTKNDLFKVIGQVDVMAGKILATMADLCDQADSIFSTAESSTHLYYELLRNAAVIEGLSPMTNYTLASPSLLDVISHFRSHIADNADSEEINAAINAQLDSMPRAAPSKMPAPLLEAHHEGFLRHAFRLAAEDVLQCL